MDLLAIMFDAEPCGHLLVNGRQPNPRQLAAVCGTTVDEVSSALSELEDSGVFSRNDDGVIYNRRMVRDKAISDEASENGKRGGNPALTGSLKPQSKQGVKRGVKGQDKAEATPPLIHQEAEAEAYTPIVPTGDAEAVNVLDVLNACSRPDMDRDFDEFWSAYEKKEGKKSARRAFDKARKKLSQAQIMAAVRAWPFEKNRRNGADFNPMPASWLNGERWADDNIIQATSSPVHVVEKSPAYLAAEARYFEARRIWAQNGCEGPVPRLEDFLAEIEA